MNIVHKSKEEVKTLSPAYFTFPMSIGILSIGAHFLKFPVINEILFWSNNVVLAILLLLVIARLLSFPKKVVKDLNNFKKGAGFLSIVAAISILGIQYGLRQNYAIGIVLFWISLGLWIFLLYSFILSVTTGKDKPSLEKGMSGVWLLIVVSIQALVIHGAPLAGHLPFPKEQVIFLCLCLYTLGIFLYLVLITLIFYRLTYFPAKPKEITPPYWVNEGAIGITAIAGALLIQNIDSSTGFTDLKPIIEFVSLLSWATATWWIPVIIMLEIWKYGIKKEKISYTPTYWALVFCVGGYAVATLLLSRITGLTVLQQLPEPVFYVALGLSLLVLLGLMISLSKSLSK